MGPPNGYSIICWNGNGIVLVLWDKEVSKSIYFANDNKENRKELE